MSNNALVSVEIFYFLFCYVEGSHDFGIAWPKVLVYQNDIQQFFLTHIIMSQNAKIKCVVFICAFISLFGFHIFCYNILH